MEPQVLVMEFVLSRANFHSLATLEMLEKLGKRTMARCSKVVPELSTQMSNMGDSG